MAWEISLIYKTASDKTEAYLLSVDSMSIEKLDKSSIMTIHMKVDNFDKVKAWGHGICAFESMSIDEDTLPEFILKGNIKVRDFSNKSIIDSIPISSKAHVKKGHGSYFLR